MMDVWTMERKMDIRTSLSAVGFQLGGGQSSKCKKERLKCMLRYWHSSTPWVSRGGRLTLTKAMAITSENVPLEMDLTR